MFESLLPVAMFAVLGILLFSGYPVALVLGGIGLGFGAVGYLFGDFLPIEFFNIAPRIWSGIAENLILTAVPMFILMGTALERSGLAEDLLRCLLLLLRRVPGALAFSVILLGTILAAMTGIIGASVVMISVMALPMMMARSYSPELATGTVAAASTLGILIPPSIMLVMMSDLMTVSVGNMFLAALLPGLLLSGLYMVHVVVTALLRPSLAPSRDEDAAAGTGGIVALVARTFVPPVALIALVLGSIFAGWASPTEASGVGAAGALLFAWLKGRLGFRTLQEIVEATALTSAMIFFIFMGATAFSYVFRSLGGDDVITDLVLSTGLGSWGILIVLMMVVFVLGFFLDWVEITLIVLPVFMPIVRLMDFGSHVEGREVVYWFAILMAVNLQTSFLTPPFGFALFYMKGVAPPGITIGHIYRGIVPFVILQIIGLALVAAFPQIALWLPRQILR
jgi:tripartite ATP-independent transporter DctM subunit